jgi:hypothetical protein
MKRLMMYAVLGALLAGTTGCHIGDCWRSAWNSRCNRQQAMVCSEPCIVSDSPCDTCYGGTATVMPSAPCSSCAQ